MARACLGLIALALVGCAKAPAGDPGKDPPRLVVLLVVDALRPDHLGCYGYPKPTSPAIDAFAASSVRFVNAFAASSWTKPSIPSLLTGTLPSVHGVLEGSSEDEEGRITSDVLPAEALTLAEALAGAGYRTAAFVQNAQLKPFLGFDQGFDLYREGVGDAAAIHGAFLDWLAGERRREKAARLFAYLHVLDVHWPYSPPEGAARLFPLPAGARDLSTAAQRELRDRVNDGRQALSEVDREAIRALYDACVRGYDEEFRGLLGALAALGELEGALVLVTADHGEEFGEQGRLGHGHSLSDALLRVPILVKLPHAASGRVDPSLVSHLDVFPTIAAACGATVAHHLPGRDLFSPRTGGLVVAEMLHRRTFVRAARTEGFQLVERFRFLGQPAPPGPAPAAGGLVPGMRVDVKGEFDGAELDAEMVSLESSDDDDLEIRGPIASIDAKRGSLRVGVFDLDVSSDAPVLVRGGRPTTLAALRVGDVVDADGEPVGPLRLRASKLELRPDKAGSDSYKIEGLIESVDPTDGDFRIGTVEVETDPATRFVGFDKPVAVIGARIPREHLAPVSLLDPRLFDRAVSLHRVREGLAEEPDVLLDQPEALERLTHLLRDSERGVRPLRTETRALDEETLAELKAIGYIN